jgi:hypothetical protein
MEENKDIKKPVLHSDNIVKGWISTIIGALIIAASAYNSIFNGVDWIWQGLTGCGVGGILVFTPDSIKEIISAVIKKKTEG